jgi:Phage gp6-like head-tail connector protein
MSLDTLANLKARLGITTSADDTLLGLLQEAADAAVANYCNRDFAGGSFTEHFPGGSDFVHLRNFPVDAVTSVKLDPAYFFGPAGNRQGMGKRVGRSNDGTSKQAVV